MKAIIVGAGEVGSYIAQQLVEENWELVVIDENEEVTKTIAEKLDVQTICDRGTDVKVLEAAGIRDAQVLMAMADLDEKNVVSCVLAREFGVPKRIARIRDIRLTSDQNSISPERIGIDFVFDTDEVIADELMRMIKTPTLTNVVDFAGGAIKFMGITVGEDSPLAYNPLSEINIDHFLAVAIVRDNQPIIPRGGNKIFPGDKLFFMTRGDTLKPVLSALKQEKYFQNKRVTILGGSRKGLALARRLEAEDFSVTVIERDRNRCCYLAANLNKSMVLYGDGKDEKFLQEEGVFDADVFVTATGKEGVNLLAALTAKHHMVNTVIAVLKQKEYVSLATSVGVDMALDEMRALADTILKYIRRGGALSVAALLDNRAEVIEMEVTETSKSANRPLRKLKVPDGAIVAAVVRGDEVVLPRGETMLRPQDRLLIFALPQAVKTIGKLFE